MQAEPNGPAHQQAKATSVLSEVSGTAQYCMAM
jgi:hypothetical protein